MLGWLRVPAALASCSKRRSRSASWARSPWTTLSATSRDEPHVARAIDLAHAALAEERYDLVRSDASARGEARRAAHADGPRLGGAVAGRRPKHEHRGPDADLVAVRELRGRLTGWPRRKVPFLLPRSSRTALAPSTTIRAWWRDTRARSMHDAGVRRAAEQVLALGSGMWRSAQTRRHWAGVRPGRGPSRDHVSGEGVAEAVDRSQQARRLRVVAQGGPDLGRQPGEARVRDEAVGPQPLVDLLLGERPRPLLKQQLEELERLGGEGLRDAAPPQLPRAAVEQARTKAQAHGRPPLGKSRFPKNSRMTWTPAGGIMHPRQPARDANRQFLRGRGTLLVGREGGWR